MQHTYYKPLLRFWSLKSMQNDQSDLVYRCMPVQTHFECRIPAAAQYCNAHAASCNAIIDTLFWHHQWLPRRITWPFTSKPAVNARHAKAVRARRKERRLLRECKIAKRKGDFASDRVSALQLHVDCQRRIHRNALLGKRREESNKSIYC